MKIIFIITALCIILKKSGAVAAFLDRLKTEPEQTAARKNTEPTAAAPDQLTDHERDRLQWENDAYYILTLQGYKHPETVRYMGDEMLISIIRDYLTTNEIL